MVGSLSLGFWALALVTVVGVPLYAWRVRGRGYAIFGLVILAVSLPGAVAMQARLLAWAPSGLHLALAGAFAYGMAAAGTHLAALVRARLRPAPFRLLVSIPGMVFVAAGALSGLWLLVLLPVRALLESLGWQGALAVLRGLDMVPLVIVAGSIVTSARLVPEIVRVTLATEGPPTVSRVPVERYRRRRPSILSERPLRILQIADPHLGPWQPVRTLGRRLAQLVAREPDLVLLTGDFLTMEGVGTPGALAEALAPLGRTRGRAFAILGNHDHGCEDEVRAALDANGIRLLVDEEALVATPVGPVQIVGADWVGRGCREHIQQLVARHPRRAEHLRLLLLHDPRVFRHVPPGDVDLTLSGHTHGGQLGLLSLGLNWTVLSRSAWPDHGLFGHGASRLYVHRGTGFYGFPLRIGVPGEASILEVVAPLKAAAAPT
ncbi:MAG: phosphodiesterase [Deltaproteobacteria bacterium]|nr:MAG: phosphodiesterase [Deltaproteobacteria bacterium]